MIGRRIGAYRLEEEVGRGGMGVVFRAARIDGEFDQTVAIKLIKRGMDTEAVLKRFRRERQITAALNHPNIAYFYGGGSTDDGLPYFVMEFISGLPLYKYCDRQRLAIRDRLEVIRQICWAVQAAHDAGVIHRDLKPSNILVTHKGKPKLLDFGIAKVLVPDLEATDHNTTATQMRVMTPEYASPEQISGNEVTPASDIYSLGVILYELLTGHRPYSFHRNVPDEVERVIREEFPTNPSGVLTREDGLVPMNGDMVSVDSITIARAATAEDLRRELTGDLDRIVLKALRKDPAERYASATALADDITNYLENRPVRAEFFVSMSDLSVEAVTGKLTLAILPFRVLGNTGDTGEAFLGIGLADALISRLSGVPRLIVRPTTSILPFAAEDPSVAGSRLGVEYVLTGNIRIAGNRIRISVQLMNAVEQSTLWAKAFDEDLGDVLEIEDSLSAQVASSLLPRLTSEERKRLEKRGTNVPAAYEAYLRGRYFWSKFSDEGLMKAVEEFNRAVQLDPEYALPYIGLADYYAWSAIFGEIASEDAFPKAEAAARKALEIDDSLADAYAILAFCVFLHKYNWRDAEFLVKRALELNPNHGFAHECYSNILCTRGKTEEAINEIRIAEELDPVSPRAILMTAWTLYQTRRFAEAEASARKALSMQPGLAQALLHLGNILSSSGKQDEAIAVLRKSAETWRGSGLPRYMLAFARAAEGNIDAVKNIIGKFELLAEQQHMKPYFIAMAYVAAGEYDTAFNYFEKAVEAWNEWMVWFGTEPKLDPIRNDPRFSGILKLIGNPLVMSDRPRYDGSSAGSSKKTIAVLPFRFVGVADSADSSQRYLGLALADAVTMRLSNVRKFTVRPTSSVLSFSENSVDAFIAGRELGVEFVVDGVIIPVGSRIRVTAQLLSVAEGAVRWAESFKSEYGDVLQLEDSISQQVVKTLIPHLTGEDRQQLDRRGTRNPQAYDAYLQGRYFWSQFEPDSFQKAIEAFSRAADLDPDFALAKVGIADFYAWASIYGIIRSSDALPKMLENASAAVASDPGLAEGFAALGLYHSNMQEWDEAENLYRKAVDMNPNYPLAHEWLSSILIAKGMFDEGIEELETAESLDPLSLRPKVLSAWTYYQAREFQRAASKAAELVDLAPDFMQSHLQSANIFLEIDEPEKALHHALRAEELAPASALPLYVLCGALVAGGNTNEAIARLEKWKNMAEAVYVPPYFLALSSFVLGDHDKGFEYLDMARLEHSAWTIWTATEPKLDAARQDPRYKELLLKMNGPQLP